MPRIALFSRRDVEKGEELTFDYMASKPHSKLIPHFSPPKHWKSDINAWKVSNIWSE